MTVPMHRLIPFALAALTIVLPTAARAQEPVMRTEEIQRQQEEKARQLRPYKGPWIERQLLAIERAGGFGVPRGLFVTFGDIKRGSGIALGPAYGKMLASGTIIGAKAAYSIRSYKVVQLWTQSPPLADGRVKFSARARWQDAPSVQLYALGTNPPKTRTTYSETKTEVGGDLAFRPVRALRFGAGAGFERFVTGPARRIDPATSFLLDAAPGAGADPSYIHGRAFAAVDSRDGEGYSRRGTLLRGTIHDYRQQDDGPFSFQRVDGDAEQYIPILHGNWVLYLAAHASTTSAASGHAVPFFLMPDLGGHDLRGFNNYRFRDRHSISMTAEYRWYAQEFFEGAIFYDAGKTVHDRSALNFDGLKSSVGAGVRFHGRRTSVLRLEVAKSREGLRILMAFSPVGQ